MAFDEFSLLHENAQEHGLAFDGPPVVRRVTVTVEPGRDLSALVWGDDDPRLVLVHGGGQNAHTWDTVALALGIPLVAVDLAHHGRSDVAPAGPLAFRAHAADLAVALAALAPRARAVVGMSLGGLSAIALTALAPERVRDLVLVDVLPTIDQVAADDIRAFVNGPESFESFEAVLERTVAHNPTRSRSSLRRGVLHNAYQRPDGRWAWRHQRVRPTFDRSSRDYGGLWEDLEAARSPVLLVRGMAHGSVIDDAGVAELRRRRPDAEVVEVAEAGHSIQGDAPLRLAQVLAERLT